MEKGHLPWSNFMVHGATGPELWIFIRCRSRSLDSGGFILDSMEFAAENTFILYWQFSSNLGHCNHSIHSNSKDLNKRIRNLNRCQKMCLLNMLISYTSLISYALFIFQSLIRLGVDLPGNKILTLFQLRIPNICSDKLCELEPFFVMQFTSYMHA